VNQRPSTECERVALLVSAGDEPGVDPYDGLSGTRVPEWVRGHSRARQAVLQLRKRTPLPLDKVLGVAPKSFAKAEGAKLTAVSRCAFLDDSCGAWPRTASRLAERLSGLALTTASEGGWSYEFDVQTRWAFYPAGSPNLIATFFVGRGFALDGLVRDTLASRQLFSDACAFMCEQLLRDGDSPYFCYTPTSDRLVHNANLLGAGIVAAAGAILQREDWVRTALSAALTTVALQREDGSWAYGEGPGLGWSDNFHTAYSLDGLLLAYLATGDVRIRAALDRGFAHWSKTFFGPEGAPRYFSTTRYPYDIHSAGTAVDVAARLATWEWNAEGLAERVAEWTTRNLVDNVSGLSYYQKHRLWTDRRHFTRWGDAHLALGYSSLALLRANERDPLETAVAAASGVDPRAR